MTPDIYNLPVGYRGDTYLSPTFRKVNEVGPLLTSGTIQNGQIYLIKEYKGSDNFTNVGAAENKTGEVFTATGTTPMIWTGASVLVKVEPISLVSATIISHWVKNCEVVKRFTTSDGSIVIDSEVNGIFRYANFAPDFHGHGVYDIQVTFGDDTVHTIIKGKWVIDKDITTL